MDSLLKVLCSNTKWQATIPSSMNGNTTCKLKIFSRVTDDTKSPPHSHTTSILPNTGMAPIIPDITPKPQYPIWLSGITYPKKAIPIVSIYIAIPASMTPQAKHTTGWYSIAFVV